MIDLTNTIPINMEPGIDLGDTDLNTVSPAVADKRANKAAFGDSADYNNAYSDILGGRERDLRATIAAERNQATASDMADFISTRKSPLDLEEINAKFNTKQNPNSVFEDNYARQYVNYFSQPPGDFVDADENGTWHQMTTVAPEYIDRLNSISYNTKALQEVLRTGLEDAKAARENQSYLGYGVDLAKSLTQLYPELKLRGGISGAEFGLGLGTAMSNQRKALWDLPFNAAKTQYRNKLDQLIQDNPAMAEQWATQMLGVSESDEFVNNLYTAAAPIDLFQGAMLLKDVAVGGKAIAEAITVRNMSKELVKAPDVTTVPLKAAAADAAGLNDASAQFRAANKLMDLPGTDQVKETIDSFQSALKSDMSRATSRPGNYGSEILNRIQEAYTQSTDKMINAITNVARVQRIGDVLASETVVKAAWNEIRENYKGLNNSILQLNEPKVDLLNGGYSVDMILGRADGTFFSSMDEARAWAALNDINISHYNGVPALRGKKKTGAYLLQAPEEIVSNLGVTGKKFYLALNKPLRETDNLIRDSLLETNASKDVNKGFLNSLGLPAWVRTPEEVLDRQQRTNRLTAVYAPGILKQVLTDSMKEVRQARGRWRGGFNLPLVMKNLGKGSEFERFMQLTLEKVDPETGRPGFEWSDVPAVDTAFRQMIGRPAEPLEVEAYFGYQRGLAMDWSFRNLALYRNMRRVGGETHSLYYFDEARNKIASDPFVGVVHKSMPDANAQAAPILLMDDSGHRIYMTNGIHNSARGRAAIKGLSTGEYKLIELYNRDLRPLNGFKSLTDENIRYALTKNVETRPLEFQQIPRQKGGHIVYDYDHYIKQANISVETAFREKKPFYRYEGDNTLMPIGNRLMGNDLVKGLNEVREALASGDLGKAKLAGSKLPIPWEDLHSWFYPKRGPGGKMMPARFGFQEEFHVVPRNKSIKDIPNDWQSRYTHDGEYRLRDGTSSGSLARQFQVEFSGERDAQTMYTIMNEGSRDKPVWSYKPAEFADPITVLNRSLSRVIDSLWLEDYKISSMEHWLQEAINVGAFKESTDDIRSAPFYHFMNTKLKSGLAPEVSQLLEAKRFMIKSFNGVPSSMQAWIDGVQQTLADTIYGSTGLKRASALVSKYGLTTITEAPAFLRAAAYRADIGLFSIPQLIVQSMTYVSIFGIAGYGRAGQGTLGALLHQYSRFNRNPAILDALDNIAVKMGHYKPGEWKEAMEALSRTGFEHVGAESNTLMAHYNTEPRIVKGSLGTFLDAGDAPFKGGERNVRYGAWYTAYKDFREAKPTGRITQKDLNDILLKADLYAGNMTKASKSALQMGPLAFPAQFLGYQMRLIELFTGKRLNTMQRARLFGTYALMYGVPVSASAVALGLPINEQIKKYGLEHGYVDGENKIAEGIMDGAPAALIHMIFQKRYNIAERFGPNALDLYRDVLSGDKSFLSLFTGASGALVTNSFQAIDPFFDWARSFLNNDGKYIKVTPDTIAGVLKPIASANNVMRLGAAIGTGVWRSRNETPLKEGVSPLDAIMMSATGLQPMEASDARVIKDATETQKSLQNEAAFKFTREFQRGLQSLNNKDYDNASTYFANADAILSVYRYPQQKRDELLAQAVQGQTMPDRMTWTYYLGREVPAGAEDSRVSTYSRIQQMKLQEENK